MCSPSTGASLLFVALMEIFLYLKYQLTTCGKFLMNSFECYLGMFRLEGREYGDYESEIHTVHEFAIATYQKSYVPNRFITSVWIEFLLKIILYRKLNILVEIFIFQGDTKQLLTFDNFLSKRFFP